MTDQVAALRVQVARQVAHWTIAVSRLEDLEALASPAAWAGLESYLGVALRQSLTGAVTRLQKEAAVLRARFDAAQTGEDLERVRSQVVAFRGRYTRTATLVNFYGDAVNTRTTPNIAALLRACDVMAVRSMTQVLDPLGKTTPPVMTYLDIEGLGAAILKAGLRLWDGGTLSAVAAVKIAFHNLFRPTALIHEAGHQFAHITGWNEELAGVLEQELSGASRDVAEIWGSWASEIAADTFAFAHTGYAAVVSLCDVLSGDEATVFQPRPGDPHPTPALCRHRPRLGAEARTSGSLRHVRLARRDHRHAEYVKPRCNSSGRAPTISPAFAHESKQRYPTYESPRGFDLSHRSDETNGNMGALPGRRSDLPVPDARRFSHGYLRRIDQES